MRSRWRRRYSSWSRLWKPGRPIQLSDRGLRTLSLAGLLPEGLSVPVAEEESPIVEKRRRTFLEKRINREAPDIRTLKTWEEAFAHFGVTRKNGSRDINDAKLIRTFIWQFVVRVLAGQDRPVRGNLRSIWYRELRSILLRLQVMAVNDEPREVEDQTGQVKTQGTPRGT